MDSTQEIIKNYIQHQLEEEEQELAENADLIKSFVKICSKKGIELNETNFNYTPTIGIVAKYPNLVAYLCSDFSKDKEGLIDFNFLCNRFEKQPYAEGFLYDKNFMLMAHPYYRRGFHENSNFAPRFIQLFWRFNNPEISTFISIDYNRVRINVNNLMYMEADTWFGAKFNEEIGNINDGIVKHRPPTDIDNFMLSFAFADAYCFDVIWETKNKIKTFQSEEFKTENILVKIDGIDFHPVRYIHAEFDLVKNHFRHFDGAIHFYTNDEYYARRDNDFNFNSKNKVQIKTLSEKLFKMNGNINVKTWIEFTCHFHTGNPLVIEYFEGKYPDHIVETLDAIRKHKEK